MRKFLLCASAVAFVLTSVPAVAQTCTPTSGAISMFQKYTRAVCGLTPSNEESAAFLCEHGYPNFWLIRAGLLYCAING